MSPHKVYRANSDTWGWFTLGVMHQFQMVVSGGTKFGIHTVDGGIKSEIQLPAWKNMYLFKYGRHAIDCMHQLQILSHSNLKA